MRPTLTARRSPIVGTRTPAPPHATASEPTGLHGSLAQRIFYPNFYPRRPQGGISRRHYIPHGEGLSGARAFGLRAILPSWSCGFDYRRPLSQVGASFAVPSSRRTGAPYRGKLNTTLQSVTPAEDSKTPTARMISVGLMQAFGQRKPGPGTSWGTQVSANCTVSADLVCATFSAPGCGAWDPDEVMNWKR